MRKHIKISVIIVFVLLLSFMLAACLDTSANAAGIKQEPKANINYGVSGTGGTNINSPLNDEDEEGQLSYVVSFVTNGGTPIDSYQTLVVMEEPVTSFSGYRFAGWFTSADFTSPVVTFPYSLTQDTVLYAKWVVDGIKEIRTVQDLKDIGNAMSSSYILMNNLNLAGIDWMPLGLKLKSSEKEGKVALDGPIVPFTGSFDGNGRIIYNLTMEPKGEEQEFNYLPYGLFSIIAPGANLFNITLSTYRITLNGGFSDFYIGSLVGQMKGGSVRNCIAGGRITNPKIEYEKTIWDDFLGSYASPTSDTFIGGLIGGVMEGEVFGCASEGTIVSESVADGVFVGGLAGFNWEGNITKSRSSAMVKGRYAGNLIGYNNGRISGSNTTGSSSGSLTYPAIAGGIAAYNDINGVIERCYSIGPVSARTAGGLVGINMFNYSINSPINIAGDPIIFATGIDQEEIYIGDGGIIRNSYTTSNVTAAEYGGGLVGRAESIMPVKGKQDIKPYVVPGFYFISHNFAFGNVSVVVDEIAYEDKDGNLVTNDGVYNTVFAGGLIGHASEVRMASCLAFGNVTASSKRPIRSGDDFLYNTAYADNVVGNSSSLIRYPEGTYYNLPSRDVFGSVGQVVTRNGEVYQNFNTAEALPYLGNNDRNANSVAFLTGRQDYGGLGFSTLLWRFDNLKIEDGRLPALRDDV